jgi:O-antigen ligase
MLGKLTNSGIEPIRLHARGALTIATMMVAAVVVGFNIGHERWYLVAICIVVPVFLLWPVQTALGLFAFLVPFDEVSILGDAASGTTLTYYVGAAAALIVFIAALLNQRIELPPRPAAWWTALVLWGSATAVWAINPALCLQRLPTAGSLLLLYLVAVSVRIDKDEFSWIAFAAILGGVVAALYATSEFYHGRSYSDVETRAALIVAGRETDPNQFAASLLAPCALALGVVLYSSSRIRVMLSLAAAAVMGLAALLTMSRGGLLGILVILIYYLYKRRVSWRIMSPALVLVLLIALMPGVFFARLERSGADRGAGRLDIWRVGITALQHHAVLGVGLNNFPVVYQQFAGMAKVFHGYYRGPHNIYLGMAVETGLIGFLMFAGALRSQFRSSHAAADARRVDRQWLVSCEAACSGVLAAGFFLDIFWRKSFWLALILLTVAARIHEVRYRQQMP